MKLWFRTLLKQIVLLFFFLLTCLFAIYITVDLSTHGLKLFSSVSPFQVFTHYLSQFALELELFLSFAWLLTTLKVLSDLNHHSELVALQMAGLSKKTILRPFFLFALLLTTLLYANEQWLVPYAQNTRQHIAKKKGKPLRIYSIPLRDDSELVYQHYDPKTHTLFDLFWIRTPEEIWHSKVLELRQPLMGHEVDCFTRKETLEKTASYDTYLFYDLPLEEKELLQRFIPYEYRPLTTLLREAPLVKGPASAHLHHRMALPLLPFIILLAIPPFVLRFSRIRYTLLVTTLFIFLFIALKTLFDGLLILAENQVLPAALLIWAPFGLLFTFAIKPFLRLE